MTTWKRVGDWIRVNEGDREHQWTFPVPCGANVGSSARALGYLLEICPSTKEATRKLAIMRRALRATRGSGT